jgi:DNA modification methylase
VKPYYSEKGIEIWHGDSREVLPRLLPMSTSTPPPMDLLLTDPPYGIGVSRKAFGSGRIKGGGFLNLKGQCYQPKQFKDSDWDDEPASAELIQMARDRSRIQIIWGGNYFALPPSQGWFVWDKCNDSNDFADCELAWTNQDKAIRIFRWRWNGMLQEHGGRHKEERLHPAMKPLALMKWCLARVPDTKSVLDPWMGSGTTLEAAKQIGISAIGIEREEQYCEVAAERLRQEVLDFRKTEYEECHSDSPFCEKCGICHTEKFPCRLKIPVDFSVEQK